MNRRNGKGITLIALVVTIVVLLILAGVSISMLTGENAIIKQAQGAKENSKKSKLEEIVRLAITSLMAENKGNKRLITPEMIAKQVNKDENRTDVTAEGTTFPTNINFKEENKKVRVDENLNLGQLEVFDDSSLEAEAEKNVDLFEYEIIDTAEVSATTIDSLPKKEARITGIKQIYCNDIYGGVINPETGENVDTNYEIIYKGEIISDTLVIPYQVEIDGEMYKITEAKITARGDGDYGLPKVQTIIYPNTIEKIESNSNGNVNNEIKKVILSKNLQTIGKNTFYNCAGLSEIIIPLSVTSIEEKAFYNCAGLSEIIIPSSVTKIGREAFYNCIGLTSLTILRGVTSIGEHAFRGCYDLASITIPDSVTSIGDAAFYDSKNLREVYFEQETTPIFGNGCFMKHSGNKTKFFFKNSTVYNAFPSNCYNAKYGEKSTDYNW